MGFWQTGYGDFHEPVGLPESKPQPKRFRCRQCEEVCPSADELHNHRLEDHPLHRPVLFVQREIGNDRVRITQPLSPADVRIDHCDRALFNGSEMPSSRLPDKLAAISSGVCYIVLNKDGVEATFELDFCIASQKDLEGVEEQFEKIAHGRRLNTHLIEAFIDSTQGFPTAGGYCAGICAYLYGVLAKEQAGGSTLPYAAYEKKFNEAAEKLAAYNRPLAQTIGSLIEFHFNHFRDAADLCPESRVGRVSDRYSDWTDPPGSSGQDVTAQATLESLVTDWQTEEILRWASRPLPDLAREADALEDFLRRASADYDKTKLHILLGQLYAHIGDEDRATRHAKELRNVSSFRKWAEALIKLKEG